MMATSMGSLVWLLMFMDSFFLPPQPVGPPAKATTIYNYVISDANAVVNLDVRSIKTHFEASFKKLGTEPLVKNNPTFSMFYQQAQMNLTRGMQKAEKQMKVLKLNDIHSITVSFKLRDRMEEPPAFLISARGNFGKAKIAEIVKVHKLPWAKKEGNGYVFYLSPKKSEPSLGAAPTGELLVASSDVVTALLTKGLAPIKPNSLKAKMIADYLPKKVVNIGFQPNLKQLDFIYRNAGIFKSLLADTKAIIGSSWGGGSTLRVWATQNNTLNRYKSILTGVGQLSTASDYLRRGVVNIVDGLFDSSAPLRHPLFGMVLQNKNEILAFIRRQFDQKMLSYKVTVTPQKYVTFELVGHSGIFFPVVVGGMGYFVVGSRPVAQSPVVIAAPPKAVYKRPKMVTQPKRPMKEPAPKKAATKSATKDPAPTK